MNMLLMISSIEPLDLQGNIRLAVAILYGMILGVLLVKFDLADRSKIKQDLTFTSMSTIKMLLLALGLGMVAFALLRNMHTVQAHWQETDFWGVLTGGLCVGIGLGIGGLLPLTVITSLAAGRLYSVWFVLGMILAFPAAKSLHDLLGSALKNFSAPVSAKLETSGDVWNAGNPFLWISAFLIMLCIIMQIFGSKEKPAK